MTVEERSDQFPAGMRVLAVDDDPTCLKLLESLLRRCQYHVTTTNQAIIALKLLRENKNKFDLVISDVHMPDMDGFKLLELVGLEMDLPVIMLSANSDTRAVMKGISHGAVDYLLKPVRIEELRNIWQHVIRRKKFEKKEILDRDVAESRERVPRLNGPDCWQGPASETSESNGRLNRKRKDQIEEEDESEDNGNENDDSSTQKKPRVVWSVDLHRKFVAAVNELGIDKAVPKRILELMNVERLTRENVASHLQKYRLYLKRIHSVTSQQSSVFPNLGSKEAFLSMCSIEGMGSFNPNLASRIAPFQSAAAPVNARLNGLGGIGVQGISSSGMIQLGQGNPVQDLGIHQVPSLNQIPTATITAGNQLLGGFADSNMLFSSSRAAFIKDLQPPVNSFPAAATYSGLPQSRSMTSSRSIKNETSCISSLVDIPRLDASLCGADGAKPLSFSYEPSRLGFAEGQRQKNLEVQGQSQQEIMPGFSSVKHVGQSQLETLPGCSSVKHVGQGELGFGMFDQQPLNFPFLSGSEELIGQSSLKAKNDYPVGPSLLQLPTVANPNVGPYVDPISALIKMESDDNILLDGDLGCDFYSLEACM